MIMGILNNTLQIKFFTPSVPNFSVFTNALFNYYTSVIQFLIFQKTIIARVLVEIVLLSTIYVQLQNLVEYFLGVNLVALHFVSVLFWLLKHLDPGMSFMV